MKKLSTIISTAIMMLAGATAATASDVDTTLTYNSGILVLAFAGFLALVVVVQTIPAIITLYGMIKGAVEGSKETSQATSATNR